MDNLAAACNAPIRIGAGFMGDDAAHFLDDFLEGFPTVGRELAVQVLEEARELRLARVS